MWSCGAARSTRWQCGHDDRRLTKDCGSLLMVNSTEHILATCTCLRRLRGMLLKPGCLPTCYP